MSGPDFYARPMEKVDYNGLFPENVKKLMAVESPPLTQSALATRSKMHQRTLGRIINAEVSPTLEQMTKIAHGLDVALWQLLVPHIDAHNLPALAPGTAKERELWRSIQMAAEELSRYGKRSQ